MESPTRLFVVLFSAAFVCSISTSGVMAQSSEVSRAQSGMVTIRIGAQPEMHTIPLAAYEALLSQGVPTTLITRPAPANNAPFFRSAPAEATATGAPPMTMTGWKVGVFR